MTKIISILLILTLSENLFAWGFRGHHTICEAAVFLLEEKPLKEFLKMKPQMMGHLCNTPDNHWKSLGSEANQLGNSTHFIDADLLPLPISKIPTDFKQLIQDYTGKPSVDGAAIRSVPQDIGSIWWRADQFYRRAIAQKEIFGKSPTPKNRAEEQTDSLPFNQAVYSYIVDLGLMGHFVGDNSQPLHITKDYDGYAKGHGGIHSYYEDFLVSQFEGNLTADVIAQAKEFIKKSKQKIAKENLKTSSRFLTEPTLLAKMRTLSEISFNDLQEVFDLDPVVKKSTTKEEKGMKIKTPAERELTDAKWKKNSKLIVQQLARSAALLAQTWDQSYIEAGKPQLAAYKSYRYPFTPDFVAPDYFEIEKK